MHSHDSDSGEWHVTHFCEQLSSQTGKHVQRVDATWALPTWNGLLTEDNSLTKCARPACCFKPGNADDVLTACRLAVEHGLKISARGSGHHYGGVSLVEGGVLLDLQELRGVQVDPASLTARVGPAATGRDLRRALAPLGLHFPLPHLSDVGLAGYLLGGGNGWGVRQYGAASDNVVELEVVLLSGGRCGVGGSSVATEAAAIAASDPDAESDPDPVAVVNPVPSSEPHSCAPPAAGCRLVRVSSEADPELFWGLRGGGAFLGVVTDFVLRLHPLGLPQLPLIAATYPISLLGTLAEFFREFHATAPTSVEASLSVTGSGISGDEGSDRRGDRCGGDGGEPGDHDNSSGDGCGDHGGDDSSGGDGTAAEALGLGREGTCVREGTGGSRDGGDGGGSGGGVPAVVLLACTAFAEPGSPEVEASYAQLRALLPEARLSLQEGPMPYEEALSVLDPAWNWPGLRMYGHGAFIPVQSLRGGADGGAVSALDQAARRLTSPRSILLVCPAAPREPGVGREGAGGGVYGGASGRTAACTTASALGFRDTLYVGVYGMWTRSEGGPPADGDAAHVGWVRSCAASLEPHVVGLYVNEVMHDQPGQVRQSYEEASYERLRELKRRVDPRGLLRSL